MKNDERSVKSKKERGKKAKSSLKINGNTALNNNLNTFTELINFNTSNSTKG